ncbi:MAG: hypothetical protein IPM51_00400 [Sphingobacteriaceae bacterium]|nr:hypothetical protein [Sphingobacteriaceae bacterium]
MNNYKNTPEEDSQSQEQPKEGNAKPTTENTPDFQMGGRLNPIKVYLDTNYDFKVNSLLERIEYKKKNELEYQIISDYAENSILNRLLEKGHNCNSTLLKQILLSDFTKRYHPFIDYFNSLPLWDGEDHIDKLADTVKTHNQEFWKVCLRKWLIGVVAGAITQDQINHLLLVIQGGQGKGKSRWIRRLLPKSLVSYLYNGTLHGNNKDNLLLLQECFIINLEEFEDIKKIGALKDLVTKVNTKVRRAYARNNESITQHASFIASINERRFLVDKTGNRRFPCFEVLEKINDEVFIDMDKVYAQAYHLYKQNEKHWFDHEEQNKIEENNLSFQTMDELEEAISELFSVPISITEHTKFITSSQVLEIILEKKLVTRNYSPIHVGKKLTYLGFQRIKKDVYGYHVNIN